MGTYLDRYRNGEYEPVWAELLAQGDRVRAEPLITDAWAVARETMRRVRANVEQLIPRLQALGYQFIYPRNENGPLAYSIWDPPGAETPERLAALERLVGPIPLALRAWYEVVGSVCFIGRHPALASYASADSPPLLYGDPLVVIPLEIVLARYRDRQWLADSHEPGKVAPFALPVAPDAYGKANVESGADYALAVPDGAVDGPLLHERHQTSFVNYLRISLRWGGFPGLAYLKDPPTDLLASLTRDLLPF